MITVEKLLNQFNLDLDLPTHILKLNFVGEYTKCVFIDGDPEFPDEKCYQLIDENNGYVISLSS